MFKRNYLNTKHQKTIKKMGRNKYKYLSHIELNDDTYEGYIYCYSYYPRVPRNRDIIKIAPKKDHDRKSIRREKKLFLIIK